MSIGSLHGARPVCIICSEIEKTGVFPVSEHGEFLFLFFTLKIIHQLLPMKRLNMLLNYLSNMDLTFGLIKKLNNYYRKDLHILEVQMVNLRRKRTLWMFGLTQVHHMRQFWQDVMNYNARQMYISKVLINIVVGSTHH